MKRVQRETPERATGFFAKPSLPGDEPTKEDESDVTQDGIWRPTPSSPEWPIGADSVMATGRHRALDVLLDDIHFE